MSIKSKFNTDQLIARLKGKKKRILADLKNAQVRGMRFFEARFITLQLSGRKGNIFLNRPTGKLADSWFIQKFDEGKDFVTKLATSLKYARIHQFGGTNVIPNAFGRGITVSVTIPKRLFLFESFEVTGRILIGDEMRTSLKRSLAT